MAISMHFDGRIPDAEPLAAVETPAVVTGQLDGSQQRNDAPSIHNHSDDQVPDSTEEVRRVNTEPVTHMIQRGTALYFIQTILFYPFTISYKVINGIFYFLSSIFPFLSRLTGYYPANRTATHSIQKEYDPKDNAARVIRAFEETYGRCGLKFYEDGYAKAYDEAKKQLKFLIVILQSDEHDLTAPFNRQVLTDPRVVEFLNRDDTIVWFGNVGNSEGFQIAESLKCTRYPFVLLIAPAPKAANSSVVVMKSLVSVQGEEKDPMHFISTLEEKIEGFIPIRATLVHDRERREMERRLREEQNLAYQRSLETDRERARRVQEEQERRITEEREQKSREAEEKRRAETLEQKKTQWKLWRLAHLGPEFIPNSPEVRAARISIRAGEGSRLVRRFAGTDSIEDVYAYVECHDLLESLDDNKLSELYNHSEKYEKPANYEHEYRFRLASPMPRKLLEPRSDIPIQTENSIWPSGSLIVEEDLSDDEDD